MSHPFRKLFDTALRSSTPEENLVIEEAERLRAKGYRAEEIYEVLLKLKQGLIDDTESEIMEEAVSEFEKYVE